MAIKQITDSADERKAKSGSSAERSADLFQTALVAGQAIKQILKCEDSTMKKAFALVLLLLILVFSTQSFGQSSNASLSGTVTDISGGVIPNVTVTATNTATGVVSTVVSNAAGVYNFPSLLPGAYKVSAKMTGFNTQSYTNVALGNAAQVRLNFKLEVAGVSVDVEVSIEADRLLLDSGSSSGEVLSEGTVKNLPLVNNNALDLVRITSAYIPTGSFINNANDATIAGVSVANLNIQRDGVDVSDVRFPAGIHAPTQINPELVSEFRMITAPVDAEMGRGNSQIQVLTKSGSNAYHGAAIWDIQNSALDSGQWENNRTIPKTKNWRNLHQYTLSFGGPIIKNKTFFYALWNGQIARNRDSYNAIVLTPCARKGIFRYFDNWSNARYGQAMSLSGTAPSVSAVDLAGNPVAPPALFPSMLNADGSHKADWQPHHGNLSYASVFGVVQNASNMAADCSNAVVNTQTGVTGGGWDAYRKPIDSSGFKGDSTGFIDNFLSIMPPANNYDQSGDGLNTAAHRWTRAYRGNDNLYGVGEDNQRKQINLKVDHNFSARHRVNVSWSYEKGWSDNNLKVWPDGFGGFAERRPQVLTANFTSTLSPTLLNEARFGMSRTGTSLYGMLDNPETGTKLRELLPVVNSLPVIINPGVGGAAFQAGSSNPLGGRWGGLVTTTSIDVSPRWTYADTLTWTKGIHSFKMGGEIRLNRSKGTVYGTSVFGPSVPVATGGNPTQIQVTGINSTNMPGLNGSQTGSQLLMQQLLTFLAGGLSGVTQNFFINSPNNLSTWNDPLKEDKKIRNFQQKEFAFFFKDDWKVHENLTFNLGLRYEYYGVPYYKGGMTVGLKGGPQAAFGISGRSWDDAFWKPSTTPRADLTELIFIGPDSPNPDQKPYRQDRNNFGPAVGFAWQMPWFGKGKTLLRGGYQLSYTSTGQANSVEGIIANPPGSIYPNTYTATNTYLSLANLSSYIPVPQNLSPMKPNLVTERTQALSVYDPNFETPYIHNLTLSLTRNINSKLTMDVKYIGTLSRNSVNTFNINAPNFLTNGLLEAFNAARYGQDSDPAAGLLDQIFQKVRGAKSGAEYLRTSTRALSGVQANKLLANGNYQNLATLISNWSDPNALPGTTTNGWLLREAGFGENFVVTNPQFSTVTVTGNRGYGNYHSMQAQVTMRPTAGISFQMSYTWSKNLGNSGSSPTDPRDFDADYTVTGSDRRHVFTSYGTVELPFGPNRWLFGNSSGPLARFLESWQASWVVNLTSGSPVNWTATSMLYGTGVPDQVGEFPFDKMGVYWENGARRGNYFQNSLTFVNDPQRNLITTKNNLRNLSDLTAVADVDGNVILQNPLPGMRGNFGFNRLYYAGSWNADMAISKSIRFGESKGVQFRVDAKNIFNHPMPGTYTALTPGSPSAYAGAPTLNLSGGSTYAGDITSKVGQRTFQARIRFNF